MKIDDSSVSTFENSDLDLSKQIDMAKKLIHTLKSECNQIPMETAKLQTLEEIDNNYQKLEKLKAQVSATNDIDSKTASLLRSQQEVCSGYNIYYKTCKRDLQRQKLRLDRLLRQKIKLMETERLLAELEGKLSDNSND